MINLQGVCGWKVRLQYECLTSIEVNNPVNCPVSDILAKQIKSRQALGSGMTLFHHWDKEPIWKLHHQPNSKFCP